jgi:WD40 repeat protein
LKWGGHSELSLSIAFRPDGKIFASGSGPPDYAWRCWDVSSPLAHWLLSSGHIVNDDSEVENEVFTCKGHTVCSFPLLSHFQLIALSTYKDTIVSISFSHDGRWVLTSSLDRTSRIWEATTGAWVCTLTGHSSYVWASDFSPIGHHLVTGGGDGRIMLWRYREVDDLINK